MLYDCLIMFRWFFLRWVAFAVGNRKEPGESGLLVVFCMAIFLLMFGSGRPPHSSLFCEFVDDVL